MHVSQWPSFAVCPLVFHFSRFSRFPPVSNFFFGLWTRSEMLALIDFSPRSVPLFLATLFPVPPLVSFSLVSLAFLVSLVSPRSVPLLPALLPVLLPVLLPAPLPALFPVPLLPSISFII